MEVKKDDFKSTIEQFTDHWQILANEIKDIIKIC